ncbi:MAG: hypothetical protein ACLRYY_07855 [Anaerobutyricum soehngenii]
MYAILLGLAEKYDILLQEINDRNTIRGGTTLGPMIGSHLPMAGCDLGHPYACDAFSQRDDGYGGLC